MANLPSRVNSILAGLEELRHYLTQQREEAAFAFLRHHFETQPRFKVGKLLGVGSRNMAFRVHEKLGDDAYRKLAVKITIDRSSDFALRREIIFLKVSVSIIYISRLSLGEIL